MKQDQNPVGQTSITPYPISETLGGDKELQKAWVSPPCGLARDSPVASLGLALPVICIFLLKISLVTGISNFQGRLYFEFHFTASIRDILPGLVGVCRPIKLVS